MSGSVVQQPRTVFADQVTAVREMRRDRLISVAANLFPDVTLDDDYLWFKLMSAEASASRALRCFFTPRECYATGADPNTIAALEAAGSVLYEEPGYDFEPSMFSGGSWGAIETRQRPIINVNSIIFTYPAAASLLFEVPTTWLRVDKKYGRIQFVPLGTFMTGQLGGFVVSTIGSFEMPLMVQISYRAGLQNAAQDYPDLLDLIKKMAVLSIVEDQYLPGSASTSMDGLSQSLSWDATKYEDSIEKKIARLRQSIHGVMMGVC